MGPPVAASAAVDSRSRRRNWRSSCWLEASLASISLRRKWREGLDDGDAAGAGMIEQLDTQCVVIWPVCTTAKLQGSDSLPDAALQHLDLLALQLYLGCSPLRVLGQLSLWG